MCVAVNHATAFNSKVDRADDPARLATGVIAHSSERYFAAMLAALAPHKVGAANKAKERTTSVASGSAHGRARDSRYETQPGPDRTRSSAKSSAELARPQWSSAEQCSDGEAAVQHLLVVPLAAHDLGRHVDVAAGAACHDVRRVFLRLLAAHRCHLCTKNVAQVRQELPIANTSYATRRFIVRQVQVAKLADMPAPSASQEAPNVCKF